MNKTISVKTKISILFALLLLFIMAVAIVTANSKEIVTHEPAAQIAQIELSQEFIDDQLAVEAESVPVALVSADISEEPAESFSFIYIGGGASSRGYGWSD
jgi:hypothetical protein